MPRDLPADWLTDRGLTFMNAGTFRLFPVQARAAVEVTVRTTVESHAAIVFLVTELTCPSSLPTVLVPPCGRKKSARLACRLAPGLGNPATVSAREALRADAAVGSAIGALGNGGGGGTAISSSVVVVERPLSYNVRQRLARAAAVDARLRFGAAEEAAVEAALLPSEYEPSLFVRAIGDGCTRRAIMELPTVAGFMWAHAGEGEARVVC